MINKLPKLWRKDASLKTITIHGKKWFDRVNGNTYHSVRATVNQGMKTNSALFVNGNMDMTIITYRPCVKNW